MKKTTILAVMIFLCGFNTVFGQKLELSLLWETDTLLTTVESVIYDEASQHIYTSNIEGSPGNKDGIGSISKLDLNGKIIDRNWIKGLNAPKGMDIVDGILYVTDIDRLIEINIEKGEIIKTHQVEGASFLNDVAASSDKTIYFSDTDANKIFSLSKGKISMYMTFDSPNGLLIQGNDLLAVSWGKKTFNRVNLKTKEIKLLTEDILNPDGIEAIGNDEYIVSSWNGMIHQISKSGEKTLLLDTRDVGIFAADIDYIKRDRILLIPTFFKNKVIAYSLIYR